MHRLEINFRTFLTVAFRVGAVMVMFMTAAPAVEAATPWSDEMLDLLPASPLALLVVASSADLEEAYAQLDASVGGGQNDSLPPVELLAWLERWAQVPATAVDPTGPIAVALEWAAMGAAPPTWTFVVPLSDPEGFSATAPSQDGGASLRVAGAYAQITTPSQTPPPLATEPSPLVRDLGDADVIARLDLERLGETLLPLLRILSAAQAARAPADSTAPGPDGTARWMPFFLPLVEELFDSFSRLECALDVDSERVEVQIAKQLHGGAALAPGPQPDLDRAMKLAQFLPPGPGMRQVSALELSGLSDFLTELQLALASFTESLRPDDPAAAMQRVVWEHARELWPLQWRPAAAWLGWEEGGLGAAWIVQVEDPELWIERLFELLRLVEANANEMLSVEQSEWSAHGRSGMTWSWRVAPSPMDSSKASGANAAQASFRWIFEDLLPPIHVLAYDDLLIVRATRDRTLMDAMVDRIERGPGTPGPTLLRVREWAGSSTQLVATLETHGLLAELGSLWGQSSRAAPEPPSDPVKIRYALSVEPDAYRFRLQSSLLSIRAIAEAVRQFRSAFAGASARDSTVQGGDPAMTLAVAESLATAVGARVEEIRGRSFLEPVPVRIVDDQTARAYFISRIERFVERERLQAQQTAYEQLGLLPPGYDLYDELLELLREQAGGYYDPGERTMFLLDDMPPAMSSVILAHELTHAVDDQYFDLDSLLESVIEDDDRSNALASVLEGSGTLVMAVYSMQETMAGRLGLEAMQALQDSEMGRAEVLLSAPAVVQRSLLAPYILGQRFLGRGNAMAMLQGANAEDIDRAFREPPLSTEQVLHPEKYWEPEQRDLPRELRLTDLAEELGDGWRIVGRGRLGELDLGGLVGVEIPDVTNPESMMGNGWTNSAAAGWGTDEWIVLRKAEQSLTVLATLWDTENDASEFIAALQLPQGAIVDMRADAVVVVAGDASVEHVPLARHVLDQIAPQ